MNTLKHTSNSEPAKNKMSVTKNATKATLEIKRVSPDNGESPMSVSWIRKQEPTGKLRTVWLRTLDEEEQIL